MLREMVNGFCMALADSVPGVSGGTVAFIMGFYDKFIGSINSLVFGNIYEKKKSAIYLIKLGAGWLIGMLMAVIALSALFENHIYVVSSLFIGFIAGAIPLIINEERENIKQVTKGIVFCFIGALLVVMITFLNGSSGNASMDLSVFSIGVAVKLFFIGMVAISAMFLPGISGSTLLLIFGAYIPVISAIRGVLAFNMSYVPDLIFFGCGVLAGAILVVRIIKYCLDRFRVQTVYMIIGMMLGSFYAIVMGPVTLKVSQPPLSFGSFNIPAAVAGVVLVFGMQVMKDSSMLQRKKEKATY